MAPSSVVIKVKFADTLRRFNALVHDGGLDFDMVRLREKIRSLFSFAPDVDFTLTYVDEDGDNVTLADEDDLRDVVRQSLDPLRITVTLNADMLDRSYVNSSGNPTLLRSSQEHLPFQTLNAGVSEVLKSMPEPLQNALPKLFDLASKATSSTPVVAELMEKMKMIYLNQLSESQGGPRSGTHNGTKENTMGTSDIKDQQGLKIDGASERLPGSSSEASTDKELKFSVHAEVGGSNLKNKAVQLQQVNEGVKLGDVHPPRPVDLSNPCPDPEIFQYPDNKKVKKFNCRNCTEHNAQVAFDIPSFEKSKDTIIGVEKMKAYGFEKKVNAAEKNKGISNESPDGVQWKSTGFGASNPDYLKLYLEDSKMTEMDTIPWLRTTNASNDSGSSPVWAQGMPRAINECPFTGMPLYSDSTVNASPFTPRVPPFKKSYNQGNGIGSVFHRGVRCDGCGLHPITGPRFKSKVKHNYDLCSICFDGMGHDADYIRIDCPVTSCHPLPPKGLHDSSTRVLPHLLRGPGMKPSHPKLDSRFILDVNILDGTLMAPSTPFTKIWRMRNNGNVYWPHGSQLLWIGGDKLSKAISVDVEVPPDGFPLEKEIDIAVDFTAPKLPGRYVSYWRMATPSGQKFGQRVWVLIQVDTSMKDMGDMSLNLNLPPFPNDMKNPEVVNAEANQDPLMGNILPVEDMIKAMEWEDPFFNAQPNNHQEMTFPVNDTLIINNSGVSSTTATGTAAPAIGIGSLGPPGFMDLSGVLPTAVQPSGSGDQEENLLKELEEMGFKQVDLNKEILRLNEYNLAQSVDDLCGVSEWDPILDELREMGFADKETNKKLLKKNNGSIKRVVLDLINGETA